MGAVSVKAEQRVLREEKRDLARARAEAEAELTAASERVLAEWAALDELPRRVGAAVLRPLQVCTYTHARARARARARDTHVHPQEEAAHGIADAKLAQYAARAKLTRLSNDAGRLDGAASAARSARVLDTAATVLARINSDTVVDHARAAAAVAVALETADDAAGLSDEPPSRDELVADVLGRLGAAAEREHAATIAGMPDVGEVRSLPPHGSGGAGGGGGGGRLAATPFQR